MILINNRGGITKQKILNYNNEEVWVGMRRYYYPKNDEDLREILDFINEKYKDDVERLSMRKDK